MSEQVDLIADAQLVIDLLGRDGLRTHAKRVRALADALEAARKVLLFADGLCVAETGRPLADLYAEDCEWAQTALREAGCWPRGTFRSRQVDE